MAFKTWADAAAIEEEEEGGGGEGDFSVFGVDCDIFVLWIFNLDYVDIISDTKITEQIVLINNNKYVTRPLLFFFM